MQLGIRRLLAGSKRRGSCVAKLDCDKSTHTRMPRSSLRLQMYGCFSGKIGAMRFIGRRQELGRSFTGLGGCIRGLVEFSCSLYDKLVTSYCSIR